MLFSVKICNFDLPQPMSFGDSCVTTYSVILISNPNNNDYIKRCGRIIKEF